MATPPFHSQRLYRRHARKMPQVASRLCEFHRGEGHPRPNQLRRTMSWKIAEYRTWRAIGAALDTDPVAARCLRHSVDRSRPGARIQRHFAALDQGIV